MDVRQGFRDTVGNTPLIRLKEASENTDCDIYGKAEFLNPGGSVKDRAALYIIQDAEEKGHLKPGGVIVEGTAGNTGIGLALVGCASSYRTIIVIPDTQTEEKKDMLRLAGADLRQVPAVPYSNPENYVHVSERIAKEMAESHPHGAIWAISSTTSPTARRIIAAPGRKYGISLTARLMDSLVRLEPAAPWPVSAWRSRNAIPMSKSCSRIPWAQPSTAITNMAN